MNAPKSEIDDLIDTASRYEALPSDDHMRHLHDRVMRRAVIGGVGAGAAAGAASLWTKGATAAASGAAGLGTLATYAAVGAVAGGIFLSSNVVSNWIAPKPPEASLANGKVAGPREATPRVRGTVTQTSDLAPGRAPSIEAPSPRDGVATSEPLTVTQAATSAARETVRSPSRRANQETRETTEVAALGQENTAQPLAPATAPTAPPLPEAAEALPRQLDVLRRMRFELAARRGASALALYRDNEVLFRGGAMEPEARAALIAALCQMGRPEDAQRESMRLQQAFPNSHLARRLENACSADGANGR